MSIDSTSALKNQAYSFTKLKFPPEDCQSGITEATVKLRLQDTFIAKNSCWRSPDRPYYKRLSEVC